jgi:hypothetical protein
MKKKIYFTGVVIILLSLIYTSCKKEDQTQLSLSDLIIGIWEVQTVRQVNYEDNVKKSEYLFYLEADEIAVQFAEGGNGIMYQNGDVYGMFSWTLNGNTVILEGGDEDLEWDVTMPDNNTLIWSFTETDVTDTVTYKYELFYTASKSSE